MTFSTLESDHNETWIAHFSHSFVLTIFWNFVPYLTLSYLY
ncbi:hypothetical protein NTHI1209_00714 [Haemophilus influenzae]|uniref:Uncharacterized protein n=1 Tax=Haemophilus influenzae TaxID=727 RepID=A0A158SW67_HAEIF|nr:hypothetical protein NTHI1209_00714 [Haemophilus influenzae]